MTPAQTAYLATLLASFFADRPKQSVSDWCVQNLRFNEPGNSGPFSLAGREYSREILDAQSDPLVSDEVLVFGSQAGKTATVMGKAAWMVRNNPSRIFWVMPTRDTVQKLSRTRWSMMIRASEQLAELIPTGARRHDFSTFQQMLGGAIIDFVWSNSPAALASVPAPMVILDEVDKFDEGGRREANAVDLANQRTKNFAVPKRIKTSTPTLVEGLIWQEFLKTDQRRRFLPCPHCAKFVVLVWAKSFTCFKATGSEAEIRWDDEARRPDGSWDLDRVERSARAVCPHCGGHILDAHKTVMDRNGEWRPTARAARGYRGWHLPSLYAASAETNFGKLAVKFLQAKRSLLGLQGFINGDLAEPYESQDSQAERIEVVTERVTDDITGQANILSVDVQETLPRFYWTQLLIGKAGVHVADAGTCDTWDEVREVQTARKVDDMGVVVDSGDQTKRSGESVYIQCARYSEPADAGRDELPTLMGWTPAKGMPAFKRWRDENGAYQPYYYSSRDPYSGTSKQSICTIRLLEFSGSIFKDIFAAMRRGNGLMPLSFEKSICTEEFWRHMDAEHRIPVLNRRTGRVEREDWVKKSRHWPNHWLDTIIQGFAYAASIGALEIETG